MIDGLIPTTREEILKYRGRNFAIVDFEFTCWGENHGTRAEKSRRELLSAGLLIFQLNVSDEGVKLVPVCNFESLIQPLDDTVLDPYCIELTGITQEQVDEAPGINSVLAKMVHLLKKHNTVRLFAWGNGDKKVLANSLFRLYSHSIGTGDATYLHQYIYDIESEIRHSFKKNFRLALSLRKLFGFLKCSVMVNDEIITADNVEALEIHSAITDCALVFSIMEKYLNNTPEYHKGMKSYIKDIYKQLDEEKKGKNKASETVPKA